MLCKIVGIKRYLYSQVLKEIRKMVVITGQRQVGENVDLQYLRTKDGMEIDFVLTVDDVPEHLIEVKLTDSAPSRPLMNFAARFPYARCIQLVHNLRHEEQRGGVDRVKAGQWLAQLPV
jgi:hypothetical protein